ncbi:MAG: SUMF1/EgtB/PvdO family nonheme iron enzyme [Candidatus Aminicenantes bacterium]|nr:SUMF1/EgtB/PvdO family nonheme iron enzyme [Candidatus Aminicenantes bacterium]
MSRDIYRSKLFIFSVIFLFILLMSSDVLPGWNVSAQSDVDKLIQEGKELYKSGEYKEAILKFLIAKDLAQSSKEISEVHFNLSLAYYSNSQNVEAEESLRKSLKVEPERIIDTQYYPPGFVEMFNKVEAEFLKLKEVERKPEKPVVKTRRPVERKVKKAGGGGFIIVLVALAAGGVAAALLLGKKPLGENGTIITTTGSIQVSSSPTGAQVYLDGSNTGYTTDCTLTNVSSGSHIVSVVREGYEDEQRSVSVTAGQTATVSVTLTKPSIAVLELTSSTVWTTGVEIEIKWQTSGSAGVSTGAGLDPLIHHGRNVLDPFQRRAFQNKNSQDNEARDRGELENSGSTEKFVILSGKQSNLQGVSKKLSSSARTGDIFNRRAKDIRDIRSMSRVGIINAPVVPQISSGKFKPSGDIRVLALSNVKIDLYKGGYFNQTIVSSTANDGSYMWTVDSSLSDGADYQIRISNPNDSTSYGVSEEFEINKFQDIEWVQIASGNFQMGDNFNEGGADELPVHTVYLDTYYISKYEVTFEQYDAFCDDTSRTKPYDNGWGRGDRPVINVDYADVTAFCNWMSAETGETIYPPTEAQWEKAARGTDQRRYPWGDGAPNSGLTNYNNYVGETMPVGSYPSGVSPYGIHDMAGNVFEWCSDWYDANYYSISPTDNPPGASSGTYRVFRGGSWNNDATVIRSANRPYNTPATYGNLVGFRVCKDVSAAKSITVTEPTSITVWAQGDSVDIDWTSTGPITYVDIDLYKGGTFNQTIVSSTSNDGSYTWSQVNTSLADGSDYSIRVTDSSNSSIYDQSDEFTISGDRSITVTSPVGGEIWSTGQDVNITWTSTGFISYYVDIDVYKGGILAGYDTTENDGIYPWPVDYFFEEGTDYVVRISDESDSSIYGESGIFTINQGYEYLSQWGLYGTLDGYFNEPAGIAIDSSGNVYVADRYNHRVQKFASNGSYVTKWGSYGTGNSNFDEPWGIAVNNSSEYVYVADYYNHRVQKFTSDGTYVSQWGNNGTANGQFNNPAGIAVDSSGYVYVADSGNNRIQKFTSDGGYVRNWGSYGAGDGQFDFPTGIGVGSSGNVYVVDQQNHRIQKFSSIGSYLDQWGSSGSGDGEFSYPTGIAVDNSGNVYVSDSLNDRIQKFRSDGTFVTKWGSYGSGNGQFDWPDGVAVDSSGYVYVSDIYNYRIQKFQPIATTSSLTKLDLNNRRITESNLSTIKSLKTRPNKSRPPLTRRQRTTRKKK